MCAKHLSRLPRVFCHMPVLRHDSKLYESIDLDQSINLEWPNSIKRLFDTGFTDGT